MSRARAGLKQIGNFSFTVDEQLARRFRRHCFENNLLIGSALQEALVDYLHKVETAKDSSRAEKSAVRSLARV